MYETIKSMNESKNNRSLGKMFLVAIIIGGIVGGTIYTIKKYTGKNKT